MDNSNEFQLMLDKAIENNPLNFKGFDRTKNVQDQLQEMIYKNSGTMSIIIENYSDQFILKTNYHSSVFHGATLEQCYLMLAMKMRLNKTWDSETWKT